MLYVITNKKIKYYLIILIVNRLLVTLDPMISSLRKSAIKKSSIYSGESLDIFLPEEKEQEGKNDDDNNNDNDDAAEEKEIDEES